MKPKQLKEIKQRMRYREYRSIKSQPIPEMAEAFRLFLEDFTKEKWICLPQLGVESPGQVRSASHPRSKAKAKPE
jgi:hypothetical protein